MCKRRDNNPGYCKVRFTGKAGSTAGLVVKHEIARHMTVGDLSRYFPYGEFRKMDVLEISPVFETWEDAFRHQF